MDLHMEKNKHQRDSSTKIKGSTSSTEFSFSQEDETFDDAHLPALTFVAEAVTSSNKEQGYKCSMYIKKEPHKFHVKMIASELRETNFRVCLDGTILPSKFQSSLSLGNQCRDYRIKMEASEAQGESYKAFKVEVKYTKVPRPLEKIGSWAMELLPGVAYANGFWQILQTNPSHEIVFKIYGKSGGNTMTITLPQVTFVKDDLCAANILSAIPDLYYWDPEIRNLEFPSFFSFLAEVDQAVCEVNEEKIITFDRKIFNSTIRKNDCDLLVAQDCKKVQNYKPHFLIWTKQPNPQHPREVYINVSSTGIKILPQQGKLQAFCNGNPIPVHGKLCEPCTANINICDNNSTIWIEARAHGLANVTYDAITLSIKVTSEMKGNTCGLCGDNNGELINESLMQNLKLASRDTDNLHSWSCVTAATTLPESETTLPTQL